MPLQMTRRTELIWQAFKWYLPPHTRLESVYRSANDQLFLIVQRAKKQGYVFHKNPVVGDIDSWNEAWKLVNTKENPIAPPGRSLHQRGLAFDLSGPDLNAIIVALKRAVADRRIHLLKGSPKNPRLEGHCVHVEIDQGLLDSEPFDFA